ncbi:hypothetical protein [Paucibacter sp. Y2R2-4]|uniref:hypothetical protein n=1 Tax=Paucibacter sp. Y2R2-4 TaxID=2893553 RepID=UPI0021E401A4|nr:hypothetical protein [Paucibacter sp. Y2R2-4]MCV2351693.1 hypothetical protein [Paucibacter sp. Y2R2-4]
MRRLKMPESRCLPWFALCSLLLLSGGVQALDCERLYQERLKTDLSLDYRAFDQTEGQGFRALVREPGCEKQAADLIEAYIAANGAKQSSLRWHIAQLRATQGDTVAAVRYSKTVLSDKDDRKPGSLRWNDYVRATIAFLEKDRVALQSHRDAVAAGKDEHFGNALNLKLLDSLLRHFDRDYAFASLQIE